jgi:hypothetical protein
MTRADSGLCVAAGVLLLILAATWREASTVRVPLVETAVAVFAIALAIAGFAGLIVHRRAVSRAKLVTAAPVRTRRGTPVRRPARHMP